MEFALLDYCVSIGYVLVVVGFAVCMSRRQRSSEDYFLAGRGLTWGMIGASLVGANILAEHFAEKGYLVGLAYASYQWTAAVAMVLLALFLLPKLLRRGVYTIPEYLESRYSAGARGLMAFYMLAAYVLVILPAVVYAGAKWTEASLGLPLVAGIWVLGLIAGVYTVWGGLRAVVWAGLLNGLGLILGGATITVLGLLALGGGQGFFHGVAAFFHQAGARLETVRSFSHPEIPWVAVFLGGMWIFQVFYWGLNQSVTQRALGAKSVAEAQKGMLLGASLELLVPFVIIVPAMLAFQLFARDVRVPDRAYGYVACRLLPIGLRGLMFATLFGAVLSSLDAMLNSASTIVIVDFYKRHRGRQASDRSLVRLGRAATGGLVVVACLWAPLLGWIVGHGGMFYYIQTTLGLIAPGIAAAFFFGLFSKRTSSQAAVGAMLLGPALCMGCLKLMPDVAFLHHMAFTFAALLVYMFLVTVLCPLRDVEVASDSGTAVESRRPEGLLRNRLIPFGTAILGSYLFGLALFQFSWIALLQASDRWQLDEMPEWIHFINAGVPTVIYFAASLWLMRLPAPSARLVAAAKAVRPARSVFRALLARTAALLAAVVVGLHAYMFCLWMIPQFPRDSYWQGYDVNLSAIGTGQPVFTQKSLDEEELGRGAAFDADPSDADPSEAAAETDLEKLLEAAEEARVEQGVVAVYVTPLVIGILSAGAFLIGLRILRRIPARPEAEPGPAVKLDLAPSRLAPFWGALVILCTLLLYYLF